MPGVIAIFHTQLINVPTFAMEPDMEHGKVVHWLGHFLKGTQKIGLIFTPDPTSRLEVYIDADFAINWNKEEAVED